MKKPQQLPGLSASSIIEAFKVAELVQGVAACDPASQLSLDLAKVAARNQE